LNVLYQDQFTALIVAISAKQVVIVELLLEKGASANLANENSMTPLALAVVQQDEACVKLMLDHLGDQVDLEIQKDCIAIASGEITQDTLDGAYRYNQVLMTIAPRSSSFKHNYACYCHLKGEVANANRYFLEALALKRSADILTEYANFLIQRREILAAQGITESSDLYLNEARSLQDNSGLIYSQMEKPALDGVLSAELKHAGGEITLKPWFMATWLLINLYHEAEKNDLAIALLAELKTYVLSHQDDRMAHVLSAYAACLLNDFDCAKALLPKIDHPSDALLDKIPGSRELIAEATASVQRVVEIPDEATSLTPIASRNFYAFLQTKKLLPQDMPYDHFEAHFASHVERTDVQEAYQLFMAGQSGIMTADAASFEITQPTPALLAPSAQSSTSAVSPSTVAVGLFGTSELASPLATLLIQTQKQIPEPGQVQLIFKMEKEAEDCQRQLQVTTQSASAAAAAASSPSDYAIEAITIIDENEAGVSAASTAAAVRSSYAITLTKADYNQILRNSRAYDELETVFRAMQHHHR